MHTPHIHTMFVERWHTVDDTLVRDLAYSSIQFTVLLRLNTKLSDKRVARKVCLCVMVQSYREQQQM